MVKVVLMSHGGLASAMLKSAQMIAGDAANFYTVDMMPDDGIEGTKKKLDNVLNPKCQFKLEKC